MLLDDQTLVIENMSSNDSQRYDILRQLALSGAVTRDAKAGVEEALKLTSAYLGLASASALVWDENQQVRLNAAFSGDQETATRLNSLESHLFARLRTEHDLEAAYMSFSGDYPCHTFTLPMRYGGRLFGAFIGIQTGARTVVSEDLFLDAFTAAIAVQFAAMDALGSVSSSEIDQEKRKAVVETAVTVNHEVNNPLTAILGNVQLLLLKRDDLDDELKSKLKVIEESAFRIREVTQKLMQLTSVRSTEYTDGTTMIDLSSDDEETD